jgi:hypothetical protein
MILNLVLVHAADSYYGISVGLSFTFGNKVNRMGLMLGGYYAYELVQINSTINAYYNFQSLGTKLKSPELQLGIGSELGFGEKDSIRNEFIGLTENNLPSANSIGYSFVQYFDKIGTSQSTGIISMTLDKFKIAMENDVFGAGRGKRDRFRTGAIMVEYQYQNTKIGINSILWTGDYSNCKQIKDPNYPSRFGYQEKGNSIYAGYSVGILALQVRHLFPYQQVGRLNVGIDSEKVRHVFQNKLIHDQPFFKESWIWRKPPHIPMMDDNGDQFLYKDGQNVRPSTFYYSIGLNSGVFY